MELKNKRGQEEIVGFIIIVVIVAIILLFFLNFYLKSEKKESLESYEINSFIQSFLSYTTECRDYLEYFSIQDLIFECDSKGVCLDGQESCEILNSTLEDIITESWQIGEDRPIKGYELEITMDNKEFLSFTEGNITQNYKSGMQELTKRATPIEVFFRVYY